MLLIGPTSIADRAQNMAKNFGGDVVQNVGRVCAQIKT